MQFLKSLLLGLFGRTKCSDTEPVDHLPGERARTKDTGMTAQQMAWRKVGDRVDDRRKADQPRRVSEFERLLRK